MGFPAAVTFATGFQVNLGVIAAIAGKGDIVFCDKENHASIQDACRLTFADVKRFRHGDMEDLENKLKAAKTEAGKLIVVDGVFSMLGRITNLPEIVRLARLYGARVMVDDAHGVGVLGEQGRGTPEHFGLIGPRFRRRHRWRYLFQVAGLPGGLRRGQRGGHSLRQACCPLLDVQR